MSTVEYYPSVGVAEDGQVKADGSNDSWVGWATAAGTDFANNGVVYVGCQSGTLGYWNTISRMIFSFDTTALPLNANFSSANVQLYCDLKVHDVDRADTYCLYTCTPDDITALDKDDYDYTKFDFTLCSDDTKGYSDFTVDEWATWELNAYGLSKINKGGITIFAVCLYSLDGLYENSLLVVGDSAYTYVGFQCLYDGDDNTKPILEITYTEGKAYSQAYILD